VILVDTSIWVDHFRVGDDALVALIEREGVLSHPLVVGELAMGDLRPRGDILDMLQELPSAHVAREFEVLQLVEGQTLYGKGLSYIDAHLLASARITPEASLWTRDRRLSRAAQRLGLAADLPTDLSRH
jgi:predicted nucleic acid-binding protein